MSSPSRRNWFLLACIAVAALLWTHRYQYAACDTDGCVAINRWTGSITFRPSDLTEEATPPGTLVRGGRPESPSAEPGRARSAPGSQSRAARRGAGGRPPSPARVASTHTSGSR